MFSAASTAQWVTAAAAAAVAVVTIVYSSSSLSSVVRSALSRWVYRLQQDEERRLFLLNAPKRIILVRHGQSEGNVSRGRYSEVPDNKIELTPKGHEQAEAAGLRLKEILQAEDVEFYVSPYRRCIQTYEGLAKAFNPSCQKMHQDPRLREQEWGHASSTEEFNVLERERNRIGRFFYRFPQGESGADVFDRVTGFLESIFRRIDNKRRSENIVIVSHGLLMRLFLMRYYWLTVEQFEEIYNFENCEIVIMQRDVNSSKYKLLTPLRTEESPLNKPLAPSPQQQDHLRFPDAQEMLSDAVSAQEI